jgi:hypothetical protein
MRDEDAISRNLADRQDRILREGGLAERRGLTLALLHAETGLSVDTLKSYRRTKSREPAIMSLANFVKLALALPSDLSSLLIEETGLDLVAKTPVEKDWLSLGERAAALASKVCRYQSTGGVIDHREDAELTEELREFAADAQAMVATG